MINDRLFSAKHKLLEQHNGEFEKWSGHQIYLTKNNFVYTILWKLFQLMNVRRIIHLAGSVRGGVTKDFRILLFRVIWFC